MKPKRSPFFLTLLLAAPGLALAADGAALYQKHCSSCHGPQGKNGTAAPVAGLAEDVISANIQQHPLSMNAFNLSKKQVTAISKYLASLKP